jgi:hypothetical protein
MRGGEDASMTAWRGWFGLGAWLCVAAACGGATDVGDARGAVGELVVEGGPAAWGDAPRWTLRTEDITASVLAVRWLDADGGVRVEVELRVDNDGGGVFDGLAVRRSSWAMGRDALTLLADGVAVAPLSGEDRPGWFKETVEVPPEGASRKRGWLAYTLAKRPERLALELTTRHGRVAIPLIGALRGASGADVVPLVLRGPDGRPARSATVTAGGSPVERLFQGGPWLVPAGEAWQATVAASATEAAATLRGTAPTSGVATARAPAAAGSFAAALGVDLPDDRAALVDEVADRLHSADEVLALVRSIAVLPTTGLQQSPSATLRRGAGGPIDRAELARALLIRVGIPARFTCGDLTPEAALALMGGEPGDAASRAVASEVAKSLTAAGAPPSRRAGVALVPEWCWVAAQLDGAWVDQDLRPASWSSEPMPFPWRGFPGPGRELWGIDLAFQGLVRDPTSPPDAPSYKAQELITYASDAPTLSEKGFAFDMVREVSDNERALRSMLTLLDVRDASAQVGNKVPFGELQRVLLEVTWRDPLRIVRARDTVVLWDRGAQAAPFEALRAVVSGPQGATEPANLAGLAQSVWSGRWGVPGAQALVLDHALRGAAMAGALAPAGLAEPSLFLTVLADEADGRRWTRSELVLPGGPATLPGGASDAAGWGGAAALAWGGAPRAVSGLRWAKDVAGLFSLGLPSGALQTRARLEIEAQRWVGRDAEGRVWRYDPVTGGLAWMGEDEPVPRFVGERPVEPGVRGAHARWELPTLCAWTPRVAAHLGTTPTVPEGCAPAP